MVIVRYGNTDDDAYNNVEVFRNARNNPIVARTNAQNYAFYLMRSTMSQEQYVIHPCRALEPSDCGLLIGASVCSALHLLKADSSNSSLSQRAFAGT